MPSLYSLGVWFIKRKRPGRDHRPGLLGRTLVQNLQPELDDAWFKRAGNTAAAAWRAAQGTTQAAGGKVQVGVIEGIIHLGAELHFEAFYRGVEIFVQGKICGVVRRRSTRVARLVAEWAQQSAAGARRSRQ